ncbi:MAG TPA: flagellar biosynthesis anti-sigma factor FlgM [Terracidiphilus sp.]|jgi:flagellar biosynthesis anti-sigma factor FlgM|nr:flagellar biosynthesis anti-sigma factor FlgM [Terracidiphilus sp.]
MGIQTNPINSAPIDTVTSTTASSPVETKPASATSESGQLATDTADLGKISSLVSKAMEQPDVRMDKVEAIKAHLAAGTYDLNPAKIADAMIKSAANKDI